MKSMKEEWRMPPKRPKKNLNMNGQFSDLDNDNRNSYNQYNQLNEYDDPEDDFASHYDDDEDNVQSNYEEEDYSDTEMEDDEEED